MLRYFLLVFSLLATFLSATNASGADEPKYAHYSVDIPGGAAWDEVTPLQLAVAVDAPEEAARAVAEATEAEVTALAKSGRGVLHFVRSDKVAETLLAQGAPLEAVDAETETTALKHWAAMCRLAEHDEERTTRLAIVECLFTHGASLHVGWCRDGLWNKEEYTALETRRAENLASVTGAAGEATD